MTIRKFLHVSLALLASFPVVSSAQAQSAEQVLTQLQQLEGQMQQASDPCPFMPRFKQLIGQLANSSPEMYNAMKPSLDAMNEENDGCGSGGGSSNSTAGGSSSVTSSPARNSKPTFNQQTADDQRSAYADAMSRYEQSKATANSETNHTTATCSPSGWYAPPGAEPVRCRSGQMMPAAATQIQSQTPQQQPQKTASTSSQRTLSSDNSARYVASATQRASIGTAAPPTKTYTVSLNNGDLRKETIVIGATGSQITVECFAPGATVPYESYSRSGPSEFFSNLPACTRTTSKPNTPSTGEAKPADCVVDNVNGPCIPLAEWARTHQPAASSTSTAICPASGFIPGVMIQHGDTAVGVQCTPGQPYNSSASNSSPEAGGTQSGSPSAGNGSQRFVEPLSTTCVSMDFNGDYHWDQYFNNCSMVFNLTFDFPDGTSGLFDHFSPGKPESTAKTRAEYQGHGGNPSLYACPVDSHPVDANGNNFYKPIAKYRCVKLSYAK